MPSEENPSRGNDGRGGGGRLCMGDYEGRERARHRNMKSVASLIGKRKD